MTPLRSPSKPRSDVVGGGRAVLRVGAAASLNDGYLARERSGSPGRLPSMTGGSWAGCGCSRKPNQGLPSVEVLFALMARPDDEDQSRRAYVEPQDVSGGANWNDEFAQCRA